MCISCVPFQKKIYKINKEYNEKKKEKYNIGYVNRCPDGAYYEDCGSGCGLPHCGNQFERPTPCPSVCVEGCVCTGGKLLDLRINECVYKEDCSNLIINY